MDPDDKELRQEIERAFTPRVRPGDSLLFSFDPLMKPNVELLAELKVS